MNFLFKNYSIVEVAYLLIRCNKLFLWNINNTDRIGLNEQNTRHQTLRERKHEKRGGGGGGGGGCPTMSLVK